MIFSISSFFQPSLESNIWVKNEIQIRGRAELIDISDVSEFCVGVGLGPER